jgi:hypothetical protein
MKRSLVFISLIILFACGTEKRIQYIANDPKVEIDTIFLGKGLIAYGDTIKLDGKFETNVYPEFPDTIGCTGDSIMIAGKCYEFVHAKADTIWCNRPCEQPDTVIFDTIHVLLAIVDTSANSRINDLAREHIKDNIFFMWAEYGYDVITHDMVGEIHVKYLDNDKLPITNYFVQPLTIVK